MNAPVRTRNIPLGEVVEIKGGGTPSKSVPSYYDGDIPWVTPKDMKVWEISNSIDKITQEAIRSSATNLVPPNSVLLVNQSGILKHTLPVGITRRPVAINQDIKALVCGKNAHPDYVARVVKAAEPIVLGWVRATTADNFPIDNLRRLEIPLPPLAEQKRIAAILDQADALRRLRRRALDRLNTLGQAIFQEMFGDAADAAPGWTARRLGEVADVASGITKGRKPGSASTRPVPYLAVSNVQDRHLQLDVVKKIEATDDEIERYRLRCDDLLLTEGGDPDKLGRGTLWAEEIPECIHQNHIFRVRVTSEEIRPVFLNWMVGSERGKRYFLRSSKQTTGIASINKTQLNDFPLLVPPLDDQLRFERRLGEVGRMSKVIASASKASDSLFASLQHRAFTGQL